MLCYFRAVTQALGKPCLKKARAWAAASSMSKVFTSCICKNKQDEDVRVLDYRHCSLNEVPREIFNFERTLEELYVGANQIKDLPRELFYCHGLKKLNLSDNEITSIPPAIASLVNLEHLDISKNGILDLPENIKCCKYLSVVEASVNPLGKLPDGFTQLLNLTQLFLNDTFLDYLPGNFGRLSKLKILEVRENHLKTLPKSISRLTELERLDIGQNDFSELPEVVGSLVNLLELWCDSNQITQLPAALGTCKNLMYLDATKNRIDWIAPEIEGCVSLSDLHLTTNLLGELPESIGRLSNLTTLKVDDNQLTSLPFSIGGLVSLSELNVAANDLEEIPPSIGLLRHLRTLIADENFLMELPPELGSCSGLTVLSLRSNKLTYVPDEIGRIPRLRVLNLAGNEIRAIPYSFMKLKELQALWLAENQAQPLIRLQSDIDVDTGKRMLTCYLLPQQASNPEDIYSDDNSFHPSMWEEENRNRRVIQFDFGDQPDPEVIKLSRVPTPYPKEMKEKLRHTRNMQMRQLITNGDVRWNSSSGRGPDAVDGEQGEPPPPGPGAPPTDSAAMVTVGDTSGREPHKTHPQRHSPLLQEMHYMYKFDKEKLLKDKARMQQKQNSPDKEVENGASASKPKLKNSGQKEGSPVKSEVQQQKVDSKKGKRKNDEDDGGFLEAASSRSERRVSPQRSLDNSEAFLIKTPGYNTPGPNGLEIISESGSNSISYKSQVPVKSDAPIPADKYARYKQQVKNVILNRLEFSSDTGYLYQKQKTRYDGRRGTRSTKDYDSDTGYRSDYALYRPKLHQQQQPRPLTVGSFASDWEMRAKIQQSATQEGYTSDSEGLLQRGKLDYDHPLGRPGQLKYPALSLPENMHNANPGSSFTMQQQQQQHQPSPAWSYTTTTNITPSSVPYARRTLIRNDELYDSQQTPGTGGPRKDTDSTPTVLSRSAHNLYGDTSTHQTRIEVKPNKDDWRTELFSVLERKRQEAASGKREGQPGPGKPPEQAPQDRSFSTHTSDDEVFAPPPYRPAPPYSPKSARREQTPANMLGNRSGRDLVPRDSNSNSPQVGSGDGSGVINNNKRGGGGVYPPNYGPRPDHKPRIFKPAGDGQESDHRSRQVIRLNGPPPQTLPHKIDMSNLSRTGLVGGGHHQQHKMDSPNLNRSRPDMSDPVSASTQRPGAGAAYPPHVQQRLGGNRGEQRPLGSTSSDGSDKDRTRRFVDADGGMATNNFQSSSPMNRHSTEVRPGLPYGPPPSSSNTMHNDSSANMHRVSVLNRASQNMMDRPSPNVHSMRLSPHHDSLPHSTGPPYEHDHQRELGYDSQSNQSSDLSAKNTSLDHTSESEPPPPESHHEIRNYEDVARFKQQQQPDPLSQVSSSTDSGYGHGHHIYEKVNDLRMGGYPPSHLPPPMRAPPSPPGHPQPSPLTVHPQPSPLTIHSHPPEHHQLHRNPPDITSPVDGPYNGMDQNYPPRGQIYPGGQYDPRMTNNLRDFKPARSSPVAPLIRDHQPPLPPQQGTSRGNPYPGPPKEPIYVSRNQLFRQHNDVGSGRENGLPDQPQQSLYLGQSKYEVLPATVLKNPGLGFSIAGGRGSQGNPYRPEDQGVFVTKVQPEGPAAAELRPGDKILEVNGQNFTQVDHSRAVSILKNSGQTVSLLVERERELASKV
ncbi:uncharacterized protein LOC106174883 isoform X4 [Lingula anatina]|uniref:Uncharacterized protein LOC106174883 isoform X4 n=1 Tax=Lingula anatina TaxID=7574 RepID=A0A1S3JP01_LINAN|nr:uncharacterized protein LOC106174883 isoform X4 [Lingula anatina]|eukprot:XP_013412095.1 uncharacterized protein LOC106174883 isoform X4 [Lingula anatina]